METLKESRDIVNAILLTSRLLTRRSLAAEGGTVNGY